MNKFLTMLVCISVYGALNAAEASPVIPNASYYVFEGNKGISHREHGSLVNFYTFDGELLETINVEKYNANFGFAFLKNKVDPNAPKPQPTKFKIVYWYYGKGVPGDWTVFFDKNGNIIQAGRYKGSKPTTLENISSTLLIHPTRPGFVVSSELLDLSIIEECDASEMLDIVAYNDVRTPGHYVESDSWCTIL
jgi:hypothetical protein